MIVKFKTGDKKIYQTVVKEQDVAAFNGQIVHPVCSTYRLAQEIEWATRQFVLEMKEDHEEGIGTYLTVHHISPAWVGNILQIESEVKSLIKNELICSYNIKVGERLVAEGETGQKILRKEKIAQIFQSLKDQYDQG